MSRPVGDLKGVELDFHRCLGMGEHSVSTNVWIFFKEVLEEA